MSSDFFHLSMASKRFLTVIVPVVHSTLMPCRVKACMKANERIIYAMILSLLTDTIVSSIAAKLKNTRILGGRRDSCSAWLTLGHTTSFSLSLHPEICGAAGFCRWNLTSCIVFFSFEPAA